MLLGLRTFLCLDSRTDFKEELHAWYCKVDLKKKKTCIYRILRGAYYCNFTKLTCIQLISKYLFIYP